MTFDANFKNRTIVPEKSNPSSHRGPQGGFVESPLQRPCSRLCRRTCPSPPWSPCSAPGFHPAQCSIFCMKHPLFKSVSRMLQFQRLAHDPLTVMDWELAKSRRPPFFTTLDTCKLPRSLDQNVRPPSVRKELATRTRLNGDGELIPG